MSAVLLPLPFGPMMPRISLAETVAEKSDNARIPAKDFVAPVTVSSVFDAIVI